MFILSTSRQVDKWKYNYFILFLIVPRCTMVFWWGIYLPSCIRLTKTDEKNHSSVKIRRHFYITVLECLQWFLVPLHV
jgi:hypothetical protein